MKKFLPGMRADGVTEQCVVVAAAETVMAATLLVGPTARKIGERSDVIVYDGLIANCRANNPIT